MQSDMHRPHLQLHPRVHHVGLRPFHALFRLHDRNSRHRLQRPSFSGIPEIGGIFYTERRDFVHHAATERIRVHVRHSRRASEQPHNFGGKIKLRGNFKIEPKQNTIPKGPLDPIQILHDETLFPYPQ